MNYAKMLYYLNIRNYFQLILRDAEKCLWHKVKWKGKYNIVYNTRLQFCKKKKNTFGKDWQWNSQILTILFLDSLLKVIVLFSYVYFSNKIKIKTNIITFKILNFKQMPSILQNCNELNN